MAWEANLTLPYLTLHSHQQFFPAPRLRLTFKKYIKVVYLCMIEGCVHINKSIAFIKEFWYYFKWVIIVCRTDSIRPIYSPYLILMSFLEYRLTKSPDYWLSSIFSTKLVLARLMSTPNRRVTDLLQRNGNDCRRIKYRHLYLSAHSDSLRPPWLRWM